MKRVMMGGTAALAVGLVGSQAWAQAAFEALLATMPELRATSYEVTLDGADEIVTGLRLEPSDAREDDASLTIDRLVFHDVGDQAPGALIPSISGLTIKGMMIDSGGMEDGYLAIDRVRITGTGFPEMLAMLLDWGPDISMLDMLTSFEMEGMHGEIISEYQTFSLGRLHIRSIDAMRVGSLLVEDFRYESDSARELLTIGIARMEGADIDLGAMLATADASPDEMVEMLTRFPLTSFSMSGIEFLTDAGDFAVDGMSIGGVRVEDGVTTALSLQLTGFAISVDMLDEAQLGDIFREGGLETLIIDFALAYDIDTTAGTMIVDPFRVAVADAGTMELMLALSGLPPVEALGAFDDLTEEQAAAISLDRMRVSIEDLGLIRMGLATASRQMGMPADALIDQAVGGAQMGLGMLGGVPDLADAPEAIGRFMRESGRLTLEMAPAAPVSIMMTVFAAMADPGSAIGMLAPRLTHE